MLPITFDCIKTPDGRMRGKPAPDHLLSAMAETGEDPVDTLYVGDMEADHKAAIRAGIDYAHAMWGYGRPPEDASWILSEMSDLLDLAQSHSHQTDL
jgi:phosphoglycolate phosphatase